MRADRARRVRGQHVQVRDAAFWPKRLHRIPFWFGGSASIRSAVATHGDDWAPAAPQLGGFGPEGAAVYRAHLDSVREEAVLHGRLGRIGGGAVFLSVISERPDDIERAASLLRRRDEYASMSLDDTNDIGAVILGTPDEICRRIEPYVQAGV